MSTTGVLAVVLAGAAGYVGAAGTDARLARLRRTTGHRRATASESVPGSTRAWWPAVSREKPPSSVRGRSWLAGRLGAFLLERAPAVAVALAVAAALTGHALVAVMVFSVSITVLLPARRRAVELARRGERMVRDLPQVADLLASCLEAGAAPAAALDAVCAAVGGPLADALGPVAVALRLGEDPARAWSRAAADRTGPGAEVLPIPVRRLCRAVARASVTGAPLAGTLSGLAEQERERLRWSAEAAARRAGVRAVGPLGACFLPAFLLLGVVPAVASVAGEVLTDLR